MKRLSVLLIVLLPVFCFADSVVPIDKVKRSVNIRLSPDSSSEVVGQLNQGDSILLVKSVTDWHEVALEGGATGYISADWTKVIDDEEIVAESTLVETLPETSTEAVEDAIVAVFPTEEIVEEEVAAAEARGGSHRDDALAGPEMKLQVVDEPEHHAPAFRSQVVAGLGHDACPGNLGDGGRYLLPRLVSRCSEFQGRDRVRRVRRVARDTVGR